MPVNDVTPSELRMTLQKLARRIRSMRGDQHISDSQLAVLWRLDASGPASPGELAAAERVSPPSMNRTLNSLEEAGYVSRAQHGDDGRRVVVALTEAGGHLTAETRRLRDEWFGSRFDELSPDEQRRLLDAADVLRKLADS